MDGQKHLSRLNPRVVAGITSADVEAEMTQAGVHSEGVRIMGARGEFLAVRVDNVGFALARRVKEIMLSLGSDAAVAESVWRGGESETPLLISTTRRQYKNMLRQLCGDCQEATHLGDAIAETLDNYGRRDFRLSLPGGSLELATGRPVLMGILNVTPDSFSDGGEFAETKTAVEQALRMAADGAAIIDVGGESTRPGSRGVSTEEEIARVVPVIESITSEVACPVSIDTTKPEVARAAFEAGASVINDVTALGDAEMRRFAAQAGCPVILMHMKGTPRTMQKSPFYRDLMGEITLFLREAVGRAVEGGVDFEQIVVDPGIGFGKSVRHNLEILRRLKVLASLGRPIMVGTSRKSFIGKIVDAEVKERAFGTAASVALALDRGAHILRVHDVKEMREAAAVAAGISTA